MTSPKAVIFDVDGTLLDWDSSIDRALASLASIEPAVGPTQAEAFRRALRDVAFVERDGVVVDRRYWMLHIDPVTPWRAALGADDARAEATARRFRSLLRPVAYGDAAPALRELRGHCALAVMSNSPRVEEVLAELGLREEFGVVVAADEDHRKPDPRAFLDACDAAGVAPAVATYVGDSITLDAEAAVAAGLGSVWIDRYGDAWTPPAAITRIASLAELPAIALA